MKKLRCPNCTRSYAVKKTLRPSTRFSCRVCGYRSTYEDLLDEQFVVLGSGGGGVATLERPRVRHLAPVETGSGVGRKLVPVLVGVQALLLMVALGIWFSGPAAPTSTDSESKSTRASTKVVGGGESPQQVFDKVQTAAKQEDLDTVWACHTPPAQDKLLGTMVFAAGFATLGDEPAKKELEAITKRYFPNGEAKPKTQNKSLEDGLQAIGALVEPEHKLDCLKELYAFLDAHAKSTPNQNDAQLKNVKIDGDKATGEVVKPDGKTRIWTFEQVDGRWFVADEKAPNS